MFDLLSHHVLKCVIYEVFPILSIAFKVGVTKGSRADLCKISAAPLPSLYPSFLHLIKHEQIDGPPTVFFDRTPDHELGGGAALVKDAY